MKCYIPNVYLRQVTVMILNWHVLFQHALLRYKNRWNALCCITKQVFKVIYLSTKSSHLVHTGDLRSTLASHNLIFRVGYTLWILLKKGPLSSFHICGFLAFNTWQCCVWLRAADWSHNCASETCWGHICSWCAPTCAICLHKSAKYGTKHTVVTWNTVRQYVQCTNRFTPPIM